jgi:hypothetical protein
LQRKGPAHLREVPRTYGVAGDKFNTSVRNITRFVYHAKDADESASKMMWDVEQDVCIHVYSRPRPEISGSIPDKVSSLVNTNSRLKPFAQYSRKLAAASQTFSAQYIRANVPRRAFSSIYAALKHYHAWASNDGTPQPKRDEAVMHEETIHRVQSIPFAS